MIFSNHPCVKRIRRWLIPALCLVVFGCQGLRAAEPGEEEGATEAKVKPPKLVIKGLGLLDNRKLKRMVLQTYPEEKSNQPFDANFVEDTFVIMRNQLEVDGFQEAVVDAELTLVGGEVIELKWDGKSELEVPRPIAVREARFDAEEGPLFHYSSFELAGLTAVPTEQDRKSVV